MNRTELEIKLSNDRAWTLETFAAMSEADLHRDLKASRHDPESKWTAKDHLVHLTGVEKAFNHMIEQHLAGNSRNLGVNEDGSQRSREEIMTVVHEMNEAWVTAHRQKSFNEIIALGQQVRAETLTLLAGLADEQLDEKLPNLPFPDTSIAGILALNGDHARQHYKWVSEALTSKE